MAACYCASPGNAGAPQSLAVRPSRQTSARDRSLPVPEADGAFRARVSDRLTFQQYPRLVLSDGKRTTRYSHSRHRSSDTGSIPWRAPNAPKRVRNRAINTPAECPGRSMAFATQPVIAGHHWAANPHRTGEVRSRSAQNVRTVSRLGWCFPEGKGDPERAPRTREVGA